MTTYIEAGSGFLFGALDRPDPGRPTKAPVLICAPWGWTETASYRGRREWGRLLADAGHPVLRFDLPAVGDSSGSPRDPALHDAWVRAIVLASRWLRGRYESAPTLTALGLGLGGLLALEAIPAGASIDAVALWATPAGGRAFVRETRAFARMQAWHGATSGGSPLADGWLEAGGFLLTAETVESLGRLDPTALAVSPTLRRALLLGRDGAAPSAPLREHLEGAGVAVSVGPGDGWERFTSHPAFSRVSAAVARSLASWLAAADADAEGARHSSASAPAADRESVELERAGVEVRESLLSFPLAAGAGFGVVTEPVRQPAKEACGVFLNAAAIRHIGPNRLWVDAGRELAARGFRSARVDFQGIGESDGDSTRFTEEAAFFAADQKDQVEAILNRLEACGKGDRFVLVGLCSGGYWSFRTALEDPRVAGALLLNPGAFRWRPTLLMERQGHGFSILLRRDLWTRLARGQLSVWKIAAVTRYLVARARAAIAGRLAGARGRSKPGRETAPDPGLEADFDLLQASGKQVTIAFTDNEVLLRESKRTSTLDELDRWPNLRLVTLPGVDHALAPTAAQRFAFDLIVAQFERLSDPADGA